MYSDVEMEVEMKTAPKKKTLKKPVLPDSPMDDLLEERKTLSTKTMINEALKELHTRKGVSLQAIKKYLKEKHGVDTEKKNFYIKKYLKSAVEAGTIVQTKGIGASGSFKLAPAKKSEKKVLKPKNSEKSENDEKIPKKVIKKSEKSSSEGKKEKGKKMAEADVKVTKKTKGKENTSETKEPKMKKVKLDKQTQEKPTKTAKTDNGTKKATKNKITSQEVESAKKTLMKRRKSIGSIIKPPKMKPKAKN